MTHGMSEDDQYFSLQKEAAFPLLKGKRIKGELVAHLGWEDTVGPQEAFDLDLSAFLVNADGKVPDGDRYYCVFYHNRRSADGSTWHAGDRQHGGASDGDGETISVHLGNVSDDVQRIVFVVSIYDAGGRGQTFRAVSNAHIRFRGEVVGGTGGLEEIERLGLDEQLGSETAVAIGEIYRAVKGWQFRRLVRGYPSLIEVGQAYGVEFRA